MERGRSPRNAGGRAGSGSINPLASHAKIPNSFPRTAPMCDCRVQVGPRLRYHAARTAASRRWRTTASTVASAMNEKMSRLMKLADELVDAAQRLGLEVRRERILREVGYRVR